MPQYLHMLRNEVARYQPNLIIIILVHNDFNESFDYQRGVYTSSFWKVKIENGKVIKEISPKFFQTLWYSPIRNYSAIWKYLAYRQKVKFGTLRNLILNNKQEKREVYQANVSVSTVIRNKNKLLADFIFREIKQYADNAGTDVIIAIDGDRQSIYLNENIDQLYETGALNMNLIAKSSAHDNMIRFIDPHPIFEKTYRKNAEKFEF